MIFVVICFIALFGLDFQLVNGSEEKNIKYNLPYANRRDSGISNLFQLPDLNLAGFSNEFSHGNQDNSGVPVIASSDYNSPATVYSIAQPYYNAPAVPSDSYSPSPSDTYHIPVSPSYAPSYGPPPVKSTTKKKFQIFALAGLCVMFVAVLWIFMRRVYFGVVGYPESFVRRSIETSLLPSIGNIEQILNWISEYSISSKTLRMDRKWNHS